MKTKGILFILLFFHNFGISQILSDTCSFGFGYETNSRLETTYIGRQQTSFTIALEPYLIFKPFSNLSICPQYSIRFSTGAYYQSDRIQNLGGYVRFFPNFIYKQDWINQRISPYIQLGYWVTNEDRILMNDEIVSIKSNKFKNTYLQPSIGTLVKLKGRFYCNIFFLLHFYNYKIHKSGLNFSFEYYF